MPPAASLDVDGTLVDTNYHHVIAWYPAFCRNGIVLPLWRIHRHIGTGGDQVERQRGDGIRAAEKEPISSMRASWPTAGPPRPLSRPASRIPTSSSPLSRRRAEAKRLDETPLA